MKKNKKVQKNHSSHDTELEMTTAGGKAGRFDYENKKNEEFI